MNRRLLGVICFGLICQLWPLAASGQEDQNPNQLIDFLSKATGVSRDSLAKEFSNLYSSLLEDTETLNKVLDTYIIQRPGISFLSDVDLKFKTFQTSDQNNGAALGFHYAYGKDINRHLFSEKSASSSGVSFALKAEGNVAFDRRLNPEDFLDSKLSFHFFHSHGGVASLADTVIANRLNDLEDKLVVITDPDSLDNSPLWKEFLSTVTERLTTQFYVDFSLRAGLESNQDFSQRQYVYGAHLGLDLKAWNRNSSLANLNIFDWPFAVLRVLTGQDKELSPRGSVIPTILVGLEQVNPQDDSLRVQIENDSVYPRVKGEISFKTPISRSADFLANFRYYKELGASSAAKAASIDEFVCFTSSVSLSNGMFVSYTTGKLPFDTTDDQIYELGFRYRFD